MRTTRLKNGKTVNTLTIHENLGIKLIIAHNNFMYSFILLIKIRDNIILVPTVYPIIHLGPRRSSIGPFSPSVTFSVIIRPPDMVRWSNDRYALSNG